MVAEEREARRTHHEVEKVLEHHVCCVLRTGEASLHHCETRLHEDHENRTDQDEGVICKDARLTDVHRVLRRYRSGPQQDR